MNGYLSLQTRTEEEPGVLAVSEMLAQFIWDLSSVDVSGAVSVSGTEWQDTPSVDVSGAASVSGTGAASVDGTEWQDAPSVSGTGAASVDGTE